MRYPKLTDDQRQLLFEKVKESLEANLSTMYVDPSDVGIVEILEHAGYLTINRQYRMEGMAQITLTQLALDYFRWYHRPRVYKAISSWWASLKGVAKSVIIGLVIALLAKVLSEPVLHFVR